MNEVIMLPLLKEGNLDSECSFHFGGAPFFALVEVKNGEISDMSVKQNPGPIPDGCLTPVKFAQSNGAGKVIARGIGGRPLLGFFDASIEVYHGIAGTVRENVQAFIEGKLERIEGATCGGK